MIDASVMTAILDSLIEPVLFADAKHVIRYMNKAAVEHYDDGDRLLGRSLLDCHNDRSRETIAEALAEFSSGAEERLISESEKQRIFMRAVRDREGLVMGYYERYEKRET
jgi:nitrogen-specific signal transduction histidine kinase